MGTGGYELPNLLAVELDELVFVGGGAGFRDLYRNFRRFPTAGFVIPAWEYAARGVVGRA